MQSSSKGGLVYSTDGGPMCPECRRPVSDCTCKAKAAPVGDGNTVRVAADKLDTFLARNGELLVARRRVQSRIGDLLALHDFVARVPGTSVLVSGTLVAYEQLVIVERIEGTDS